VNRPKLQVAVLGTILATLFACSAGDPSEVGSAQQAAVPNAGFLPWPVVGTEPDQELSWNGTLVDLMAADAFGFCAPWWRTDQDDEADAETDEYLAHLLSLMPQNPCGPPGPTLPEADWWFTGEVRSDALRWAWQRTQHKECNRDLQNDTPAVVDGPALDNDALIERWSAYDVLTEHWTIENGNLMREAASEVGLAGMNLCMASRLREQMLSADVLIASGSEQRELLEVIRQRAQLAVLQFTLLGLVFTDSGMTGMPTTSWQYLPALHEFGTASTTQLNKLGRDYAEALRILVDTTEEMTELLARSASARSSLIELGGHESWTSKDEIWGDASWRGRLLNLLYGGDPLGTAPVAEGTPGAAKSFNAEWGRMSGIPGVFPASPRGLPHVVTRTTGPEVYSLLGLARQADALYLAYNGFEGLPATTGEFLYRAVEAELLRQRCRKNAEPSCVFYADGSEAENAVEDYPNTELWRLFRISPEHATTLAAILHEVFRTGADDLAAFEVDRAALVLSGSFAFANNPPQLQTDQVDRWLHVDPAFGGADPPPALLASRYQSNAGFFLPKNFVALASPLLQGFVLRRPSAGQINDNFGSPNAAARYLGAVPALAAVREGLLTGATRAPSSPYFALAPAMMETIAAAIGPVSYSLRPKVEAVQVSEYISGPPVGCHGLTTCTAVVHEGGDSDAQVAIDVILPESFSGGDIVAVDQSTMLAATGRENDVRYVANVALSENFTAPDHAGLTAGMTRQDLNGIAGTTLQIGTPALGVVRGSATLSWSNDVPVEPMDDGGVVLLLRTGIAPDYNYEVLADATGLFSLVMRDEQSSGSGAPTYCVDGKYGSIGGSFNAKAAQVWASQVPNFAEPGFDAFGLPTKWIPATNPDLFGGNEGEDSVAYYLRSAKTAADEATTAVRFALESVIAEKADSQKLQAQRDRSQGIRELQVVELCGDKSGCPAPMFAPYRPFVSVVYTSHAPWTAYAGFVAHLSKYIPAISTENSPYFLLTPVADALTKNVGHKENIPPDLSRYHGGELQALAIKQWNAVRSLELGIEAALVQMSALDHATASASMHVNALEEQLEQLQTAEAALKKQALIRMQYNCGLTCFNAPPPATGCINAMQEALKATKSWPKEKGAPPDRASFPPEWSWTENNGPLLAQLNACADAAIVNQNLPPVVGINEADVEAAAEDARAKAAEAWSAVLTNLSKIATWVADIELTNAEIASALTKHELAQQRLNLDLAVEQAGVASQLTLSRRYHHYDFWRARALLEDARRLSTAARRAIEGRFAVNLSEMEGNEPFVAAPALWADEVYEYDLNAPAAVGLSIAPTSNKDGLYPNKVSDYVKNLENFVRGYSVKRPTASALGDAEVVTMAGPEVRQTFSSGGDEATIVTGQSTGWTFRCKEGDAWTTNPAAAPPGKAAINWSFLKPTAPPGPPFENEGYGPPLNLSVFSGAFGAPQPALGGRAMDFDGTSELWSGDTTVGETSGGITVLTWVNLRSYHAIGSIPILKHRPSSPEWVAVALVETQSAGGPGGWQGVVNIGGVNQGLNASLPIPLNQWVQLGMTFDGHVQRLFYNGIAIDSVERVPAADPPASIDWGEHGGWNIGKSVNGWIGPTIIDSTVYTPERIAADYEKTVAYTKPSLAWQFKEAGAPYGNVGSAGPLPLNPGGSGAPIAGQSSPSGLPSVDLSGGKLLQTGSTQLGESPAEITVSAWVYVRNDSNSSDTLVILVKDDDLVGANGASVTLVDQGGQIWTQVKTSTMFVWTAMPEVPRNQWAHVAMTFDGTTVRIYRNGVEGTPGTVTGAPLAIDWGSHGPWSVGGFQTLTSFDGMISDVRIEPRARTAAEIADLYHRGLSGACYLDDACVGTLSCCPERTEESPLRTMCDGKPPERAKISFNLDPWGRQNDYYANPVHGTSQRALGSYGGEPRRRRRARLLARNGSDRVLRRVLPPLQPLARRAHLGIRLQRQLGRLRAAHRPSRGRQGARD
jgi:hypothetical protein